MAKYDYMKLARKRTWNEAEVNAFKRFISQDTQSSKNALNEFHNNPLIYDAEGINLSPALVKKGFKYLYNLGFTSRGQIRSNSPFGYREYEIIEKPKDIVLLDFYQPSFWKDFRVPLYQAIGGGTSMDYYTYNGEISIVG